MEVGEDEFRRAKDGDYFKKELSIEIDGDLIRRHSHDRKSSIHKKG